jgi:RimJ/RimL family protein N-acetyltransferase
MAVKPAAPLVTTRRLELWQPCADDLAGLHAMMDDAETVRFVGGHIPTEAEDFSRLLRNAGSWALYGYGVFMVRFRGERQIVGSCGVFRSHRGFGADKGFDDVPEAGWIVHRDCWGQGVAQEAMQAALDWFDQTHGKQRVVCMIEEGHAASDRVATALGFVRTGEHVLEEDGTDVVMMLYERG